MFNDIDWTKIGNSDECISIATEVSDYAKKFPRGHWSFLGLGDERNMGWNVQVQARKKMGPASRSND